MSAAEAASKIFLVEGNIAAGKTTLVECLCERYGLVQVPEPVADNPYLENFYKDPAAYALPMQLWFFKQRLAAYENALAVASDPACPGVVLDRSVFSDYVFALNSHVDGSISDEGFRQYCEEYDSVLRSLPAPAGIVFLDVSPEDCLYRVKNVRRRPCEQSIPLEYLQGLDVCYRTFLDKMEACCPVHRLDWSQYGQASEVFGIMMPAALVPPEPAL